MDINLAPSSTLGVPASHAVYLRPTWADAWTDYSQFLQCLSVSWATGEALGSATFRYRHLDYLAPNALLFAARSPVPINPRSYVRVSVSGADGRSGLEWVGVWRAAAINDTEQRASAVSLDWLLYQPLRDSPWLDNATVRWAGRGLPFNAGKLPNRSSGRHEINGKDVYIWQPSLAAAKYWSTRDAVETLLAMSAPKTPSDSVVFNWEPFGLTALPDWDQIQLDTHGRDYVDLLRAIVSRFRLTGWRVQPTIVDGEIENRFQAFTFADLPISVFDRAGAEIGQIPANAAADTLRVDLDATAAAELNSEASHLVDQVLVIGDRRQVVCTLSKLDDSLDRLWTDAEQTAYIDAAKNEPDYPTDVDQQRERDRAFRQQEWVRHVFAHFALPASWDQTTGDGSGTAAKKGIVWTDEGETEVFRLYRPEIRLASDLPLLSGYYYGGAAIGQAAKGLDFIFTDWQGAVQAVDWQGTPPAHRGAQLTTPNEPIGMMLFVRAVEAEHDPAGLERWQLGESLGGHANLIQPDDANNRRWSADVRPLPDHPGLEISVQGEEQHVLSFYYLTGIASPIYIPGAIDWSELIVTAALDDPRDVEVRFPADDDLEPWGDQVNQLRIEAPGYGLVDVRPNTIVGIDPRTLQLVKSDGGLLVDDRDVMLQIAQRAWQWHRIPRSALVVSSAIVDGSLVIGRRIVLFRDAHGLYPINSVVTEVTVQFPFAESPTPPLPKMTVSTAFAELDPLNLY